MSQQLSDLLHQLRSGSTSPELDQQFPFYPMEAPGIPLPGDDFVAHAISLGDTPPTIDGKGSGKRLTGYGPALHYLYRRALYDEQFQLPVVTSGRQTVAKFVPGHLWGSETGGMGGGPLPADVMLVGKAPGSEDVEHQRNFAGPIYDVLVNALGDLGVTGGDYARWYITNLCKFPAQNRDGGAIPKMHIKDCEILLAQELRLVLPRYILCLGSEVSKYFLGAAYGVNNMVGRVIDYQFPIHGPGEEPRYHKCKMMAVTSPAAVFRAPEQNDEFVAQLGLFWQLVNGVDVGKGETDIDHGTIYTEAHLKAVVDAAIADPDPNACIIALDGEWEGQYPDDDGAYLRTIQFSYKDKWARTVALRDVGGVPLFHPSPEAAIAQLRRLCKSTPERQVRIGGHFLRADMPWLLHAGLDVRAEYAPHPDPRVRNKGGWDTSLAYHAYNETARYKLEDVATRFTTAPRYDADLQLWKKDFCAKRKFKAEDLEGYGECPGHILYPYGCLHYDSRVQLADGSWEKIGFLVKHRYAGKVKAFKNGRVVDAQVTNWHRTKVDKQDWFRLRTASTPSCKYGLTGPMFTPDHEIITQRGKVRVDSLVPGEDGIITDEREFSSEQLSVFIGSLLGDGGFTRQNANGVGFGFSQRVAKREYLDWKAGVFSTHAPAFRDRAEYPRYELAFSKYLRRLSDDFPTKSVEEHAHRKAVITSELLSQLGVLGLAVWYQDDGTLVSDDEWDSSRIYAEIDETEQQLVVAWLTDQFGFGVSYNQKNCFIQLAGPAFRRFHAAIAEFMHPSMSYKTTAPVLFAPVVPQDGEPFCEIIQEVVPWVYGGPRRGNHVRYCLTVADTGNFLTHAGFVSNCYDADVTRRIIMKLLFNPAPLLFNDCHGNDAWYPYWLSHMASLAFLEMEMTGFVVDRQRADELTKSFMLTREQLLTELRTEANWPTFNPASAPQCVALLFGDSYSKKLDKVTGQQMSVRPPGAITLGLTPIKSTGKRSKMWADLVARGQTAGASPSTDKEVLGMLGHSNPLARKLRDLKFISQVLTTTLRRPRQDDEGEFVQDDDGNFEYDKGLVAAMSRDGRVHTHLSQVKETGRAASARPNLQALSSRREADYKRIIGKDRHKHPVRSVLMVPPGCVGIEADISGAELAVLAWQSQDPLMIDHVRRNQLPENDPDHYGIHARQAVAAFKLQCPPTKSGLKQANVTHLYTAAKNVNFGVPYGRGALAISRQCKEEGADVSEAEAQMLIDAYHATYQQVEPYLKECRVRSQNPGWIVGPHGRFRRFNRANDRQGVGDQERQAQNFTIQNGVADHVSQALYHLYNYRFQFDREELWYDIAMQIHDSVVLIVPAQHAARVWEEVLPECLVNRVPFWPRHLDGRLRTEITQPYYFGTERKAFIHWGESITPEEGQALGLPEWMVAA